MNKIYCYVCVNKKGWRGGTERVEGRNRKKVYYKGRHIELPSPVIWKFGNITKFIPKRK